MTLSRVTTEPIASYKLVGTTQYLIEKVITSSLFSFLSLEGATQLTPALVLSEF